MYGGCGSPQETEDARRFPHILQRAYLRLRKLTRGCEL